MRNLEKIINRLRSGQRIEIVYEAPVIEEYGKPWKVDEDKRVVIRMGYFVLYSSGKEIGHLPHDKPFIYVQKEVDNVPIDHGHSLANPSDFCRNNRKLHSKKSFRYLGSLMNTADIIRLSDIKSIKRLKVR